MAYMGDNYYMGANYWLYPAWNRLQTGGTSTGCSAVARSVRCPVAKQGKRGRKAAREAARLPPAQFFSGPGTQAVPSNGLNYFQSQKDSASPITTGIAMGEKCKNATVAGNEDQS